MAGGGAQALSLQVRGARVTSALRKENCICNGTHFAALDDCFPEREKKELVCATRPILTVK